MKVSSIHIFPPFLLFAHLPSQFVAAGDLLVYKCPTWSWAAGEPSRAVSYLPPDKQFLITRSVPCAKRYAPEDAASKSVGEYLDDDWLATPMEENGGQDDVVDATVVPNNASAAPPVDDDDDDGDIPDMDVPLALSLFVFSFLSIFFPLFLLPFLFIP